MNDEKIIVIDTETANTIDDPFCYDVGFAVIDRAGKVYETHSYVIADIFLDEKEMIKEAYFADKIPQYWEDIKNGKRQLRRFQTVKRIFRDVCDQYNIKIVAAHNARFDYRSINVTQRFLTSSKYRYFFPYGVEIWDTLKMAREIFGKDDEYGAFCFENGYMTKGGQRRYTAEILYRYLTRNNDFIESHTGLEDVMIEKEIFVECIKRNPEINGELWEKKGVDKAETL